MKQTARDFLQSLYLDWINNYITITKFAEHNGITPMQAESLVALGELIHNTNHPEA